jgi:predicted nuclease with TOPRIM domain
MQILQDENSTLRNQIDKKNLELEDLMDKWIMLSDKIFSH